MKIICISCGHSLELDEAYDDFAGLIKCYVCGALLEIKMSEGKLQTLNLPTMSHGSPPKTEHVGDSPA
jgi:hypothetical protein